MTTTEEQVVAVADEILDVENFDLGDYIASKGVSLPKKSVDCLTDIEAGYELQFEVQPAIDARELDYKGSVGGVPDDDEVLNDLYARRKELADRIWDTRIVFNLRGVAPAVTNMLDRDKVRRVNKAKKDKDEEFDGEDWFGNELLQRAIVSVEIPSKNVTLNGPLKPAVIKKTIDGLPFDEGQKVVNMVTVLCFGVRLVDARMDAGFPGGSPHAAAELPVESEATGSAPLA